MNESGGKGERHMSGLSGGERFKATEGLEVTQVPDGYVVYDEAQDEVHYLNPTAAVIYTVCDGTRTVDQIREFVQDAFEVTEVAGLETLFSSLEEKKLVERV